MFGQAAPSKGGPLGQPASSASTGGLFGKPTSTSSSGVGLFGSSTSTTSSMGGTFGQSSPASPFQQTASGGPFGSSSMFGQQSPGNNSYLKMHVAVPSFDLTKLFTSHSFHTNLLYIIS